MARRLMSILGACGAFAALAVPAAAATCWRHVGTDTFHLHDTLMRSQGVATDGRSWFFSWQGGVSHTLDDYTLLGAGVITPQFAPSVNPDGTNSVVSTHIGDIDYYRGLLYVPEEDGNESEGPVDVNDPEYQHPYVALYDAHTLTWTGRSYPLDVSRNGDGVPWVAVDRRRQEVYTAEWGMPHDRLNVFDLALNFRRFLPLVYPPALGPAFRLSRVQGGEVLGHTMYVSRDDQAKTVYAIDLRTGVVTRLFSLDPPNEHAELEGISVRRTADGALLHVLLVLDNQLPQQAGSVHVDFEHFAPVACGRDR